tara:strand:+ start:2460 stop:2666 length:207 start_codon:yes stop_codon:yes gene_type:complete
MVNTLRHITNLFKGIEEDFRNMSIVGWIMFIPLILLTFAIFLIAGVIALIILMDLVTKFLIDTYIKKK